MSVLFGIDEKDQIIICADKRSSTKEGCFISDDMDKVIVINPRLAFASAGNAAIEKAISVDVEKAGLDKLDIDSFLELITSFYERVKVNNCEKILMLPFYCLIAGLRNDGTSCLTNLGCVQGNLSYSVAPRALYPPPDVEWEKCNISFAHNYKSYHEQFCERTVREISNMSSLVSPTGDKWIFNKTTKTGILFSF